ncbi:hypothetical protein [Leucobacter insecticola]|uniref:hypothetical protein n=1 Tax=Leucobacter insecticola TaxID=2714934 RepID=UPI001FCC723D|nr:hypothetical protein [Leucobacter insecticola]
MSHFELLAFVNSSQLWGKGLNVIDAHVLAATLVTTGTLLWTRDKRLRAFANERSVGFDENLPSAGR